MTARDLARLAGTLVLIALFVPAAAVVAALAAASAAATRRAEKARAAR